jgi:quercetin dioxygenase-like cupin family protein
MKSLLAILACVTGILASASSDAAEVRTLMTKALPQFPGQEATMLEVRYLPGDKDVAHRHDAHAFLYVLEGTIVMQLKGQPPVTLKAGDTFYEGVDDIHMVGRNASDTAPARFIVVLLKKAGARVLTPVEAH